MHFSISGHDTVENRWYALVVIALALAIVIIDNTVLNVSIPYMLRDLSTDLSSIEWVISGYSLTLATVLITVGRLGDAFGRKKLFIYGMVIFAVGSFIGSIAADVTTIIIGRAIIQAVGAAMCLTSALSLLASNFEGKERAIAFGVWGAIAGASASVGPLLGGYLTTFFSWRWSLRINLIVAVAALIGSIFIRESFGEREKHFDWPGTVLSGAGLFSLVFGIIEGAKYGWLVPKHPFSILGFTWPFSSIAVTPVAFLAAAVLLALFVLREHSIEKRGESPLLRMSVFRNRGFAIGLIALAVLAFGFGVFFIIPLYLQNVLGFSAFETGLALLSATISIFIFGTLSGFIASRANPKWLVSIGMFLLAAGVFFLVPEISTTATIFTLAPALVLFGIGAGLGSSQLTNIIISSAPTKIAGEASAVTTTFRQIGTSIGIALMGALLAGTLLASVTANIQADPSLSAPVKETVLTELQHTDLESGQMPSIDQNLPVELSSAIKADIDHALVDSARQTLFISFFFILAGAVISLFIPKLKQEAAGRRH